MIKKLLIASVLFTSIGVASASESTVSVYGKMRIYQESYKAGTSGSLSQQTSDGSRLGFKGTEDLGNGLKAFFIIETSIAGDAPTATTLGDRTSKVGLSSNMGSFSMGRDKHSVGLLADRFDAMGNFLGTSVGTIHSLQGYRVQNAVFVTANPLKTISLNYQKASSETAGVSDSYAGGIDVNFGNFSAAYSRYDNRTNSLSDVVGLKYNFQTTGTTFFTMYSEDKVAGVKTEGKSVGINQNLGGNLVALASYGEKQGVKAINAGLNYNLSKRTSLLVRFAKEDADNNSNDLRRIGVGIDHSF
jgi:predicted porin